MVKQWMGYCSWNSYSQDSWGSICKLNFEKIKLNKETFVNDSFICFRNNFDVIQLKSILKEF